MPVIPQYESRLNPATGTGLALPRTSPAAFGARLGDELRMAGVRLDEGARRRQKEQEARDLQTARLAALKGEAELEAATEADRLEAEQSGEIDIADGLITRFGERRTAFLDGIENETVRGEAEARMIRLGSRLETRARGWQAGKKSAVAVQSYVDSTGIRGNTLFTSGDREMLAEYIEQDSLLIDSLSLPADKKAELKASTRQLYADSYVKGLAERDPYEARRLLQSGEMNALLAPNSMAGITNRIDAEIRGREAAARQAQAERQRAIADQQRMIRDMARDAIELLDSGQTLDPSELAGLVGTVATLPNGGALARRLGHAVVANATLIELRGATPVRLEAAENELAARLAKGGRDAPVVKTQLDVVRSARQRVMADAADDPLRLAAAEGVAEVPPLDLDDPDSVQARMAAAEKTARHYGGRLAPLTKGEVASFKEAFKPGATADQMMDALAGMRRLGKKGAAAAFRQVAGDSALLGHLGGLLTGRTGRTALAPMLLGKAAQTANGDLAKIEDSRGFFRAEVGRALRYIPSMQAPAQEAARLYHIGRATQEGSNPQILKQRDYRAAVQAALGGGRDQNGVQHGGLSERMGIKVVLPGGVSPAAFDRVMDRLSAADFAAGKRPVYGDGRPVPDAVLRRAYPFAAGNGRYYLATDSAGNHLMRAEDGSPFTMTVKPR